MDINITYEEAMNKAPQSLRNKIKFSVELLRKAERLALLYSPKGFYLAFSGGKDSQALYHIAQLAGVKFRAVYSVTTCDPPQLIRFIKTNYPEVEFTKPNESIYTKCIKHHSGLLPTSRIRWCCADFKENQGGDNVILTGVRKAESVRRSNRNEIEISNHKFSGSADEFEKYRRQNFENKKNKEKDFLKFKCVSGKDGVQVMPIIYWLDTDVWEFLNNIISVPHCKLYDKGNKRIGCILCPMQTYKSKLQDIKTYPHHKRKWIEVILKKYEKMPELVNLYLPADVDVFKTNIKKETAESFENKYPQRWIESAEAYFDYWIKRDNFEKWFSDTYKQLKLFK